MAVAPLSCGADEGAQEAVHPDQVAELLAGRQSGSGVAPPAQGRHLDAPLCGHYGCPGRAQRDLVGAGPGPPSGMEAVDDLKAVKHGEAFLGLAQVPEAGIGHLAGREDAVLEQ